MVSNVRIGNYGAGGNDRGRSESRAAEPFSADDLCSYSAVGNSGEVYSEPGDRVSVLEWREVLCGSMPAEERSGAALFDMRSVFGLDVDPTVERQGAYYVEISNIGGDSDIGDHRLAFEGTGEQLSDDGCCRAGDFLRGFVCLDDFE